jgi:hypothetical protein
MNERPTGDSGEDNELLTAFNRLLCAFKQNASEVLGRKANRVCARGEKAAATGNPDLDLARLTPETVASVLDFIVAVAGEAPLLKRSRLRSAAALLISNLYSRHFDILERYKILDRVEETYCRLKT